MSKKKKVILAVVAAALVVGCVSCWIGGQKAAAAAMAVTYQVTPLAPMDLSNTISTTGTVESQNSYKVYSGSAGKVESVHVKVGDRVEAGDVLCQLDTADLQLSRESTQASINQAQASAQHQMEMSQKQYDNAKADIKDKMNAQIESAKASYDLAKDAYYNAKSAWNKADDTDEDAIDEAYSTYRAAVEARKVAEDAFLLLDKPRQEQLKKYNDLQKQLAELKNEEVKDEGLIAKIEGNLIDIEADLSAGKAAWENANTAYVMAQARENAAEMAYEATFGDQSALEKLEQAYDQAKISYENAKKQVEMAENAADRQLEVYEDNIKSSKIAANSTAVQQTELKRINKQIQEATITAPISGTVTAVYAQEGASGSGLLFVVEDIDHLKISTTIKEYDIGDVAVGMKAVIKSDATGDDEYSGTVATVDPAAIKSPDGSVSSAAANKNVEFASEVTVDEESTRLKVGTNARINIVVSEKSGVYGVPYDAVVTKADGSTVVYEAVEGEKGMTAREIPVTVGMETDFYIEISGEQLKDGLNIINDPQGLTDGAPVVLSAGLV